MDKGAWGPNAEKFIPRELHEHQEKLMAFAEFAREEMHDEGQTGEADHHLCRTQALQSINQPVRLQTQEQINAHEDSYKVAIPSWYGRSSQVEHAFGHICFCIWLHRAIGPDSTYKGSLTL